MDKKKLIYLTVFIGLLFISLNFQLILASDDDNDGIDDDYEELNKRDIEIEIEADRIRVESSLRSGDKIDEIQLEITNDSDGLSIEVSYESEKDSENGTHFELEFGTIFRKLVEFIDLDENDIYDPLLDDTIQEYNLTDFQEVKYSQISISSDTTLHYFIVNTTDGIFTAHIYFSEEFFLVNDTLLTPIQSKIDIEISNFEYINSTSQLALYTSLESDDVYEEEEETEDERRNYATNEVGVNTEINNFTGIFTWKNNATIDGVSKAVTKSNLSIDDYDDSEQKIYLIYARGAHIYHDPKVGIEGIYKFDNVVDNPWFLIILVALISSLSISIGYAVYHYRERIFTGQSSDLGERNEIRRDFTDLKYSSERLEAFFANDKILDYLKGKSTDHEINMEKMKLTALSGDFFKIINMFDWEEDDLVEFIREMLSLTPEERKSIFNEMISKSEQRNKNRLDDTKRLYT